MLLLYFLGKTFFHLFWLFLLLQKRGKSNSIGFDWCLTCFDDLTCFDERDNAVPSYTYYFISCNVKDVTYTINNKYLGCT